MTQRRSLAGHSRGRAQTTRKRRRTLGDSVRVVLGASVGAWRFLKRFPIVVDEAILPLRGLDQPAIWEMLAEFKSARGRPMRDWRLTFILAGAAAAYIILAQQIFFPETSQAISYIFRPGTNIVRAVYGNLLGN